MISVQDTGGSIISYYAVFIIFYVFASITKDKNFTKILKAHAIIYFFVISLFMCIVYFTQNNSQKTNITSQDQENLQSIINHDEDLKNKFNNAIVQFTNLQNQMNTLLSQLQVQNDTYNNSNNSTQNNINTLITLLNSNASNLLNQMQNINNNNISQIISSVQELENNLSQIEILVSTLTSSSNTNLSFLFQYKDLLNAIRNIYNSSNKTYTPNIANNNDIDVIQSKIYTLNNTMQQLNNIYYDDRTAINFNNIVNFLYSNICNNFLIKNTAISNSADIKESNSFPYLDYIINTYGNGFVINAPSTFTLEYNGLNKCFNFNDNIYLWKDFIFNKTNECIIHHDISGNFYEITSQSLNIINKEINDKFFYEVNSQWLIDNSSAFFCSFTIKAGQYINIQYSNNNLFQTFNIFNNSANNLSTLSNINISNINDDTQDCEFLTLFFTENNFIVVIIVNTTNEKFTIIQYDGNNSKPIFNYNNLS